MKENHKLFESGEVKLLGQSIRKWFGELDRFLREQNYLDILHPEGLSAFKPLQYGWGKKTARDWLNQIDNINSVFTKVYFALFCQTYCKT